MIKEFSYLNDIITNIINKKPIPYELNLSGSRKSGKTYSVNEMCCKLMIIPDTRVRIYSFRNEKQDIEQSIWEEALSSFEDLEIPIHINKAYRRLKWNKNMWTFHGINEKNKRKVKLSGLAGANRYDYIVCILEEATEFTQEEVLSIKEAIRGAKNIIYIAVANPWAITNDFVRYCNKHLPFDDREMIENSKQFLMKGDKIFHYTNWRVNEYLPLVDQRGLLEVQNISPHRARTVDYGLPGMEKGTIYAHAMNKVSGIIKPSSFFQGGIDFGFKQDATASVIISSNVRFDYLNVISEYYHSNSDMVFKDHTTMCNEIVDWILNTSMDYKIIQQGITMYCDHANYTMIELLNKIAAIKGYFWMLFKPCKKVEINYRVGLQLGIIESERLNVDNKCVWFLKELALARWDDNKTKLTVLDKDNHTQDALHYAFTPWMKYLNAKLNPYLILKT